MSTAKKPRREITAGSIVVALRHQYDSKAYAFLEQVRGGTGSQGSRYADALVMSLWPSRGFDVIGFEVKVSRSDWLNELKQPEKADEIFRFCNYWFLVVSDESIIREAELPRTWGLQVVTDTGMRTLVQAPQLTPEPLTPAFVASVLRCASREEPGKERLNDQWQAGYKEGVTVGKTAAIHEAKYNEEGHQRLKKSVADFETNAGVKIGEWYGGDVGLEFKEFNDAKQSEKRVRRHLEVIRATAERILEETKALQFTSPEAQ